MSLSTSSVMSSDYKEVGSDPDTDKGRAVSLRSYLLMPEIHKDYGDSRPVKVKIGTVKDLKSKPTTTESRNAEEKQWQKKGRNMKQ